MPELPEVETIAQQLRANLLHRTILRVHILDPFLLKNVTPRRYQRSLRGRSIEAVRRSGKWILIHHPPLWSLIQPRMTGGFAFGLPRPPHARIHWQLDQPPSDLWYTDVRRLGVVMLLTPDKLQKLLAASHGPDALSIRAPVLARQLRRTSSPIKAALMKQDLIAGLGNIYAEEALFRAGIRPDRPANQLRPDELWRLARAIRQVLREAIQYRGTTFRDYRTAQGQPGGFQQRLYVYGRAGQPCRKCGTPIERCRLPGLRNRSTHYCPSCQS